MDKVLRHFLSLIGQVSGNHLLAKLSYCFIRIFKNWVCENKARLMIAKKYDFLKVNISKGFDDSNIFSTNILQSWRF
jgi:hypothetical protein